MNIIIPKAIKSTSLKISYKNLILTKKTCDEIKMVKSKDGAF